MSGDRREGLKEVEEVIRSGGLKEALRSLTPAELEALIEDARAVRMRDVRRAAQNKRERDAERHMDVVCPRCGALERTRCLSRAWRRIEESHPERAWKTRACPTCEAQPDEWCSLVAALGAGARVYVTRPHVARAA